MIGLSMLHRPESDGSTPRSTIKAMVLRALVLFLLVLCWFATVFFAQPFGQRQWTFLALAIVLTWLLAGLRRTRAQATDSSRRVQRGAGRAFFPERVVLAGALACWLGLILWSAVSPGGVMPGAPSDPDVIRVVTWNILLGRDSTWPWNRHGWPVRKPALASALAATNPHILCVQEALDAQLIFLERMMPRHQRVGVGRDDGRAAGEHCAIFFDSARFEGAGSGTFWLEEPTDRPPDRLLFGPKRICTWVRLRDRLSGRYLCVYNVHNYLTEQAQLEAVRLIRARLAAVDPADAIVLAGDFNAAPAARSRREFEGAGLVSSAALMGKPAGTPTYQFYGIRLNSFDEILVDRRWLVVEHRVLDVKPRNTFPSDHFGVMADLILREPTLRSGER
jgi:endonuclease/exonuclease/phosphatase family metal-dependent hydrolase